MTATIAIIGRPNVGKSTLFNRLVGRRLALVDDQPGVTRDLRFGDARLGPLRFRVVDTAGMDDAPADALDQRMQALSARAVAMADICLFLIDARAGVLPADRTLAEMLRRQARAVILVANKAEGRAGAAGHYDAFALGLGEPVALSAEHGEGMEDLMAALAPLLATSAAPTETAEAGPDTAEPAAYDPARPIQIAVIGRPNAGKSTLINAILGEERLLTGPEAGITRDAIAVTLDWGGRAFRIFDTAGMRKKARVQEKLEKLSVADGLRAIRFAEVVVVAIDVTQPFDQQDLRLADLAEREGRAVVFAVTKWDLATDRAATRAALAEMAERLLPQLKGAPLVPVSGIRRQGLDQLCAAILTQHRIWDTRLSTGRLNRWLAEQVAAHPPPAPGGRRIRLRYMTQTKARPPSFVAFCSQPEALPDAYRRYLVGGLRRDFGLEGVPIRLILRAGENPYAERRPRRRTTLTKHRAKR